jgi:hypothetical protein
MMLGSNFMSETESKTMSAAASKTMLAAASVWLTWKQTVLVLGE